MPSDRVFHLDRVLLPDGWADDVRVEIDAAGRIVTVSRDAAPPTDEGPTAPAIRIPLALPGLGNVHSHTFQRGMAGLAERGTGTGTDFWGWRETMYDFAGRLSPDDVERIAALAFCEMLESGFTAVGEFHYLHHAPDGTAYTDRAELAGRIAVAARATGIALTLLPVFYRHGGFGAAPATPLQRRFLNDLGGYADLLEGAARHLEGLPHARLGAAPHSLRAATTAEIREVAGLAAGLAPPPDGDGPAPVHIHIAEQTAEVESCLAATGARPVRHLIATQEVDPRWCLVHATHMDAEETVALAATGAVAGLCPVTEANLGDGLFPAAEFLAAGGRIAVGSDSNVRIDAAEELRTLEYGRRLIDRRRTVLAPAGGGSVGRSLFERAASGAARALAQPTGRIEVGARADFVVPDPEAPIFAGRSGDDLIDAWIFGGDARAIREVWVGGRRVVEAGRALARERAEAGWRDSMRRILGGMPR